MSRGHGVVQRTLVESLERHRINETAPPLSWFEPRALGMGAGRAAQSSFSRGAVGLQRMGKIERGLVAYRSAPSTNLYYRHAREPIHPDDVNSLWFQGERWRLVVRSTPTDDDRVELDRALMRWQGMHPRAHGELFHQYAKWLFSPGPGIWPEDPGVLPLTPYGSLEEVRQAIRDSDPERFLFR